MIANYHFVLHKSADDRLRLVAVSSEQYATFQCCLHAACCPFRWFLFRGDWGTAALIAMEPEHFNMLQNDLDRVVWSMIDHWYYDRVPAAYGGSSSA